MNCPHCQKELPVNLEAAQCPFCGHDLRSAQAISPPAKPSPAKLHWPVFLCVMLAPAVLTSIVVLLGANQNGAAPGIAVFGGIAAGLVCGVMMGRRVGGTGPAKILLGILFAVVMTVVCVGMSCFGCMVSGFRLDFH